MDYIVFKIGVFLKNSNLKEFQQTLLILLYQNQLFPENIFWYFGDDIIELESFLIWYWSNNGWH